jgi:hypothetical protein
MILSEFMEGNRSANVCKQQGQWVTMMYEHGKYIKDEIALNENEAEAIAENWVQRDTI